MSRGKTVFVAALVALLGAGLLWSAYRLYPRIFRDAALLLAGYGYLCAGKGFCRWLGGGALLPAAGRPDTPTERTKTPAPEIGRWDWTEEERA